MRIKLNHESHEQRNGVDTKKKNIIIIRIKLKHESHEQRIGGWCNVNQKGQRGPTSHLFTLRQRTRKAIFLEKTHNSVL